MKTPQEGDWVVVKGGFGTEPETVVQVELYDRNIKRDTPGIEYTLPNGTQKWAYIHQVVRFATEEEIAVHHPGRGVKGDA
eukprot:CAMPEP_0201539324 /NCGR_PEP_ID=MMETSP0161_2-20130828/70061_1 /ASSEMBLY_ACC=CAM_ASM_000251 /TAXON_ID=180227 /ORGANISM="Neoparamoeba aestuarina, Strain SoJaBio B1-5/56/2" /LENGTH=79 /DNA_ID=CAMNT_0047946637 /DNA_START=63 /DNA_END=302 /DNA_ORIENTATION=-